jgi:hypothetical protein
VRRPGSSSKWRYVGVAKDAYPAWSAPLSTVQGGGKRRGGIVKPKSAR